MRIANVVESSAEISGFLDSLGLPRMEMPEEASGFEGSIHLVGESWIDTWQTGDQMPPGLMIQIVVDHADGFAARARQKGLEPEGPMDAHGDQAPAGSPTVT